MADGRRTLSDISRAVNNFDRNPSRVIFGGGNAGRRRQPAQQRRGPRRRPPRRARASGARSRAGSLSCRPCSRDPYRAALRSAGAPAPSCVRGYGPGSPLRRLRRIDAAAQQAEGSLPGTTAIILAATLPESCISLFPPSEGAGRSGADCLRAMRYATPRKSRRSRSPESRARSPKCGIAPCRGPWTIFGQSRVEVLPVSAHASGRQHWAR